MLNETVIETITASQLFCVIETTVIGLAISLKAETKHKPYLINETITVVINLLQGYGCQQQGTC